jgi:hypothetical protein
MEGSGRPGSGGGSHDETRQKVLQAGVQHEDASCCSVRRAVRERGPGEARNVTVSTCAWVPEHLSRLTRSFMPRYRHDVCTWKPPAHSAVHHPCFVALVCSLHFHGPSLGEQRLFSGLFGDALSTALGPLSGVCLQKAYTTASRLQEAAYSCRGKLDRARQ